MRIILLKVLWFIALLGEIVAWPTGTVGPYIATFYLAASFQLVGCTRYCEEGEWSHQDSFISILVGMVVGGFIIIWAVRSIREWLGNRIYWSENRHY